MTGSGDFSIGGKVWPGLSKLIEECGEVCQVSGKLLGSHGDVRHWDGSNLRDRLTEELADLSAAIKFVIDYNGLDERLITARVAEKSVRFDEWHRCGQ